MSCYIRHLGDVLDELGLANNKENRIFLDRQIRAILKKEDAGCPDIWKDVKERIHDPEQKKKLVSELRETTSKG